MHQNMHLFQSALSYLCGNAISERPNPPPADASAQTDRQSDTGGCAFQSPTSISNATPSLSWRGIEENGEVIQSWEGRRELLENRMGFEPMNTCFAVRVIPVFAIAYADCTKV
jgi:hypothetical protein